MRPKQAEVEAALRASKGLLEPAARALGVGRGNLRQMLKRFARLEAVQQRQVMGDFAESKTFELMSEKHWPSIQYYLSTQCKDRGYVLPKGTALNTGEVASTMVIQNVTIRRSEREIH
jgi:hypothetical protein